MLNPTAPKNKYVVGDVLAAMQNRWTDFYGQHTPLKRQGNELRGPCPVHGGDNLQAFAVDPHTGQWFCHTQCQSGGDVFTFTERMDKVGFPEALARVAEWAGAWGAAPEEGHRPTRPAPKSPQKTLAPPLGDPVGVYAYTDEAGALLFQVLRYVTSDPKNPKTFRQRRPDAAGGWIKNIENVRLVLYRLPEVRAAAAASRPVYICEGEKDADALAALGVAATTNPMGAGKWRAAYTETLVGADVVILPDNDKAGKDHAQTVAASLQGKARRVRVVTLPDLPSKGDVSVWLTSGGEINEMLRLIKVTPDWQAGPEEQGLVEGDSVVASNVRPPNPKGPPSQHELAVLWAKENRDRYLFLEGAQWWRYEDGTWSYSSVEQVQASVQKFLTCKAISDRTGGLPAAAVSVGNVKGVVFLAQALVGPHPLSIFDANPDWIPLRNGVYDTAVHALLPHAPENRLTRQCPFAYDAAAQMPRMEQFLAETMITVKGEAVPEWVDLLQEWFGYCLTPDTSAQQAMFWVGDGGNGKGTATRLLRQLVGSLSCTSIPVEQLDDPYYRAELYGKLVGFIDEPKARAMAKNGDYFKKITGEDMLDARRPTEKVFTFQPTIRLIVSCNDLPSTRDISKGFFRRPIIIQWRREPKPDDKTGLDDELKAELPGVFNWAVAGLARWRERGRKFIIPEESRVLLDEYRKSEDNQLRFLEEVAAPKDPFAEPEELFAPTTETYNRYKLWCKDNNEAALSSNMFGRQMKLKRYESDVKWLNNRSVRVWKGLSLSPQEDESGLFPGFP